MDGKVNINSNNGEQKKNILVSGGAGFIGSHLCEELVRQGHQVICLDNFVTGTRMNIEFLLQLPNFHFIKHDIVEPIDLESLPELKPLHLDTLGLQEVYNLACPTSYKEYKELPLETILTNSHGTRNMLEIAVRYKAKFLHVSTSSVYGEPLSTIKFFKEDYWGYVSPIGPRSAYNEGKRFAESLVYNYGEYHNIQTKIARVFQTYGPRMRFDDARLIPDMIRAALKNEDLVIFGEEGKSTSFLYVSDLVEGLIKYMQADYGGVLNFGYPEEVKIEEAAKIIIELTSSTSKIVYEEAPPFIIKHGLPDITRAKDTLGWFPLIDLRTGLQKTIDYMKAQKDLLKLT